MVIDAGAAGLDRDQEFPQSCHIEMIASSQDVSPNEVLGLNRKHAMERARCRDDVQLLIEYDQRLANSSDDAVEVGAGRLVVAVARAGGRNVLFVLVCFPLMLPLLLASIDATVAAAGGGFPGTSLRVILAYDGAATCGAYLLAGAAWEE